MSGEELGPLHGIPVGIKDLFPRRACARPSARSLSPNIADRDDVLVTRLRDAGAIMIGKTTTPEFGIKGQTEGPIFGVTRNPWDLRPHARRIERRRGGGRRGGHRPYRARQRRRRIDPHSGGLLRPRRPQGHDWRRALSGSARRFRQRHRGGATHTHDRRLRDDDRRWRPRPDGSVDRQRGAFRQACAGALVARPVGHAHRLPEPDSRTEVSADVQGESGPRSTYSVRFGAEVEEVSTTSTGCRNSSACSISPRSPTTSAMSSSDTVIRRIRCCGPTSRPARNTILRPNHAVNARTRLFRAVQGLFETYDFLVSPTLTRTALDADFNGASSIVEMDGEASGPDAAGFTGFVYPFNLTGHPALAVPSGWGNDGMPTSVQIVGPRHADGGVLRLGALLEQAARGPTGDRLWPVFDGRARAAGLVVSRKRAHPDGGHAIRSARGFAGGGLSKGSETAPSPEAAARTRHYAPCSSPSSVGFRS